jgi:hypothetical protein
LAKRDWWPLAPILVLAGLLYLPACNALHRCGCRPPWAGADAACDVHRASGPHCPWCEHWTLGGLALLGIVAGPVLTFRSRLRSGASPASAATASLAALPVAIIVTGALLWLPTDHPHFIFRDARLRLGLPAGPISSP